MKKKLLLLLAVMLLTSALVFAGGNKEDDGKKVIKLGHVGSPASIFQYNSLEFEKALEELSPNIDVQVFPSGQLGGTLELMQGLQIGTVGVYPEFGYIWEGVVPEFKALAVHYTFKDNKSYRDFIYSDIMAEWNEKLIKKGGVRITGTTYGGSEFNFMSKKPIYTMADVKGVKNRCAQMAPLLESWKAYGANPTPLDWGEVYTSLATGVIDGLDNPVMDMHDEKFDEVAKYINMTGNLQSSIDFNTSEKIWQTLTAEEQDNWMKAVKIASAKGEEEYGRRFEKALEEMKAGGATIIETDTTDFIKAIENNIDDILEGNEVAIKAFKDIKAAGF
jgi:TRAP-type C4-dicarboxylate transport system substrate-binding protein